MRFDRFSDCILHISSIPSGKHTSTLYIFVYVCFSFLPIRLSKANFLSLEINEGFLRVSFVLCKEATVNGLSYGEHLFPYNFCKVFSKFSFLLNNMNKNYFFSHDGVKILINLIRMELSRCPQAFDVEWLQYAIVRYYPMPLGCRDLKTIFKSIHHICHLAQCPHPLYSNYFNIGNVVYSMFAQKEDLKRHAYFFRISIAASVKIRCGYRLRM